MSALKYLDEMRAPICTKREVLCAGYSLSAGGARADLTALDPFTIALPL